MSARAIAAGLAVAAALAAALTLWIMSGRGDPGDLDEAAPPGGAVEEAPEPRRRAALDRDPPPSPAATPTASPPPAPATAGEATTAPQTWTIRGRVVDLEGRALAAVPVGARGAPHPPLATTGKDGRFTLTLDQLDVTLVAGGGEVAAIEGSRVTQRNAAAEHVIVAARAVRIMGRVTNPGGAPLPRTTIGISLDYRALAGFPLDVRTSRRLSWSATCDADGRYELPGVPGVRAGASVFAERKGFETVAVEPDLDPSSSPHRLDFTLRPVSTDGADVVGHVTHASGAPAPRARVRLGRHETIADAAGAFRLSTGEVPRREPLVAVLRGYQPAVVEGFGRTLTYAESRPVEMNLSLGGRARELSGAVRRADGTPCAGWSVTLLDGTRLLSEELPSELAEGLAGDCGDVVTTDAEGGFRLSGLADRPYRVQAWHVESLLRTRSEPIPAGTQDALLIVPADAVLATLDGTVVSRRGRPLPHVEVTVALVTHEVEGFGSLSIFGQRTVTDAQGRFRLTSVPRRAVHLRLAGADILPASYEPPADGLTDGLTITADQLIRFRVEDPRGLAAADTVEARDDAGRAVPLTTFSSGGSTSWSRIELSDGRSPVISVPERAEQLVFLLEGVVTGRADLRLDPGTIHVVRP